MNRLSSSSSLAGLSSFVALSGEFAISLFLKKFRILPFDLPFILLGVLTFAVLFLPRTGVAMVAMLALGMLLPVVGKVDGLGGRPTDGRGGGPSCVLAILGLRNMEARRTSSI